MSRLEIHNIKGRELKLHLTTEEDEQVLPFEQVGIMMKGKEDDEQTT